MSTERIVCTNCEFGFEADLDQEDIYCPNCKVKIGGIVQVDPNVEKENEIQRLLEERTVLERKLRDIESKLTNEIPNVDVIIPEVRMVFVPLERLEKLGKARDELTVFGSIFTLFLGILIPEVIHSGPLESVSIILALVTIMMGIITWYFYRSSNDLREEIQRSVDERACKRKCEKEPDQDQEAKKKCLDDCQKKHKKKTK